MAGFLGGLAQGLGAAGQTLNYGDELRRKQQLADLQMALEKQQLAQSQAQADRRVITQGREDQEYNQGIQSEKLAALAALGMSGRDTQPPQPQPPPQGMPPQGMPGGGQPQPPPGAGAPMPQQPPQGMPQQGGAPQQPPQQPQQPSQAAAAQTAFGPPDTALGYSFGKIMQGVNKVNPGADEVTKLKAAERLQQLMAPDAKMALAEAKTDFANRALEAKFAQFEQKERDVDRRLKQGEDMLAIKQADAERKKDYGDLRNELLQAQMKGMDPREIQKHMDRLNEMEERAKLAGAKAEGGAAKADIKDAQANVDRIKEKIDAIKTNNSGIMPGPSSKDWGQLQDLLRQRSEASDALLKARKTANELLRKNKVEGVTDEDGKPRTPSPAPTPAPSPAPTPGSGKDYSSADDVAKAYKAGKLDYDQAEKILKDNGWAQ